MGTAGQKRTRIRIERQVKASDGHGTTSGTVTYAPRCVVNAHERPLNGREVLAMAQKTAVLSTVLEIWYRTDIRATDRVRIGSRSLEVESYQDPGDPPKDELYLYCSEAQA